MFVSNRVNSWSKDRKERTYFNIKTQFKNQDNIYRYQDSFKESIKKWFRSFCGNR